MDSALYQLGGTEQKPQPTRIDESQTFDVDHDLVGYDQHTIEDGFQVGAVAIASSPASSMNSHLADP